MSEKEDKITNLESQILKHRRLYYNGTPEISDAKYDSLEDQLRELDPNNYLFSEVGIDQSEMFEKRDHIIPMGSQDKVTNPEDFSKWAKKRNFTKFLVQFKLDGISIEAQYQEGIFTHAITRGDGIKGDDVTQNVRKMKGYVPKLPSSFTGGVRGEILLFRSIFNDKYSDKQNCRNTAAGIVRRKDGKGTEDLDIIYYDAVSISDDVVFKSEIQKVKWLKEQGFPTVKNKTTETTSEVIQIREDVMDHIREELEYDIDGLVIKDNKIDLEDMKRARPMKQIAFKFQAEEMETVVLNVEWSQSGHIYTPIAIVDTIQLMGSNISRASLANPNLLRELNLKIGSEVMLSKRGDIIPKIERVLKTPEDAKDIAIPEICETCNTKLTNEGTRLYCPNNDCPKRLYHRLVKWIKKLEIKNFSEKLMLKPLFSSGKAQKIADLYNLKPSNLTIFDGVKETSAKKALDNLYKVKEVSLERFIGGFDIEGIGEQLVQKVVNAGIDTLDKIKNSTKTDISRIEGFATITATTLLKGIDELYPDMKEVLNTHKITIKEKSGSETLKGLSFCFTGKLNTVKRTEAEQMVADNGGVAKKSVVKGLSYLVTNDTTPTAKYTKAQNQGTEIITEQEFLDILK